MQDFELYNTIISNPIYLSITTLLAVLIIYSALKKFIKWLVFALICFIGYLGFLYITGDEQTINDVDQMIEAGSTAVEGIVKEKIKDTIDESK
tara:strand:- start:396 stop:674 length:279 start_codon:yes stop_codon:yes gene_type:complete